MIKNWKKDIPSKTASWVGVRGLLIDLDGVVWRGRRVIPGAPEAVAQLRGAGKKIIFLSNNSAMSREDARTKLLGLGIEAELAEILTAPYATGQYIRALKPEARVLVVGSRGLVAELERAGLTVVTDPQKAEFLVVGNDMELTYDKLGRALQALLNGALFIATNDDAVLPTEHDYLPGAGATVGAIKGMIRREPDAIIGKPHSIMLEMALTAMQLSAEECVVIGDSLTTDIAMASAHGILSILVLSGNTQPGQLRGEDFPEPDAIIESLACVPSVLLGSISRMTECEG